MSVRYKIFVCLLGVAGVVWALSSYLAAEIFLKKFKGSDVQRVTENVSRVRDAIRQQKDILAVATKLWSADSHDDLQKFLQLVDLNMVAMVDSKGQLFRENWRNVANPGNTSLSPADAESLIKEMNKSQVKGAPISGIISTSYGPMLFAAYAFNQSDFGQRQENSPGQIPTGIITGRLLDGSFENFLELQLLTDVKLLPPSKNLLDMFQRPGNEIVTTPDSGDPSESRLSGYCLLDDIAGQPALALKITEARQMYNLAYSSLEFFLGITGACGLLVVIVGTLFVEVLVTRRIRKLTTSAKHADQSGMDDLPKNFTTGGDEISTLARITKSTVERLRNARLLYRAVVETQADLIVKFQPDGNISFANMAFARFVGRHQKAVPGTNISQYFTRENTGHDFLELCQTHLSNPSAGLLEIQYTNESGQETWLEWSSKSILDQSYDTDEIQIVGHDVTLRREHAKSLEIAKWAAEEANQAKAEFLAIMEHESRTPLSSILGVSLILEATGLNQEQKEYVSLIQASGHSLLALLNDLNDYSTIAKQEFTLVNSTIHVPTLIREILLMQSPSALAQGVDLDSEFAIDAPEYIEGDSSRLRQVLNNLVDNGIKFTGRGFVHLGASLAAPGQIRFYVKDSGIGISEEGIKRLFLPFGTGHPENARRHDGHGIGLVVSQKLIKQMGGKISINSQVDLGSLFYFDLPIGTPKISEPEQFPSLLAKNSTDDYSLAMLKSDSVHQNLRILVVDDNAINRKVACHLLRRIGFEAESANGGRQGIEKASAADQFDMIFMDIQMPDIDGINAAKLLRQRETQNGGVRRSYIVACTAFSQPEDRERCLKAGMDDYIKKPLELRALRQVFETYFALQPVPA